MARRSPLLLLLLLPPLALAALFFLGGGPRPPEEGVEGALREDAPRARSADLAEADGAAAGAEGALAGVGDDRSGDQAPAGSRRVGLGTRVEGRVRFADGAVAGGPVLVLARPAQFPSNWQRTARRLHAGQHVDASVHTFADADGRFALEWSGDGERLELAAMAPTAATDAAAVWNPEETSPVTLTLGPRAALLVEVRAGGGFAAGSPPSFEGEEIELGPAERSPGAVLEDITSSEAWNPSSNDRRASAWVDGEGRARILAVAVGRELRLSYDGENAAESSQAVAPLSAGEQRPVTLVLGAGATVRGRLVDSAGHPLEGVRVRAHAAGPFGMPGEQRDETKTDADGRFELTHVGKDAVVLVLSKEGFLISRAPLPDDLSDGDQRDVGDVVMEDGAQLAGEVRLPDGAPAVGAEVIAQVDPMSLGQSGGMTAWRGFRSQTKADDRGRFLLAGLVEGGRYNLEANLETDGARLHVRQQRVREGDGELLLVLEPAPKLLGRVLTPKGEPLADATVRATSEGPTGNPWMGGRTTMQSTRTDEQGNFRLELDEAGTVSLEALAPGYAPSASLSVVAPTDAVHELRLRPSLTLAGKVVDPAGNPVEGASVAKAMTFFARMQSAETESGPTAKTDADGRFALVDLPAGEIVLSARHPEHTVSTEVAVELVEGEAPEEIVLSLRRGALVRGVLFAKDGRTDAGVQIIANAMPAMETRMATTDGAGEFVLERLPPGRWQIMSMGGFDMSSDSEERGLASMLENLKMQVLELEEGVEYVVELGAPPADPVTVRGVVRRAGEPLSKGILSFVPQSGGSAGLKLASLDGAGRYEIVLPEPGGYLVTAGTGEMGGPGNAGTQVELRCDVPKAESFDFDVNLPGGAIRGRVRGPDGRPVAQTMVTWSREDGSAVGTMTGGGYGSALTDDQGQYELGLLAPGRYRVAAGGNNFGGMVDESPTTARGLRTGVQLGKDEVREGVDFELVTPGEVRGRVRDGSGKPVSSMAIFARDASGAPIETMSFVQSDPSGNFRWRGLAPGDYTFHARGGERASAESARIKVRAGEVAEVELVVGEGAYLIVRVEGTETAELLQGLVRVDVRDGDDRQMGGLFSMEDFAELLSTERSFDEQRFGPLAPGSYRASATGPDGNRVEKRVELSPGQERRLRLRLKD
ncbi:MAG: hypothetical protein GC161_10070 [Planctomycetaceae bacterium]|nr:hypothetical protein [Planctomycetaceae bacterium]